MEMTINIKKELIRDFFLYLFDKTEEGVVVISRTVDAGKLIASLVEYSDKPINQSGNTIVRLPMCDSLQSASNHFMYLSAESENKLNDYLEVSFNLDYDRYWIQGLKLGIAQQEIVYSYIVSRKLGSLNMDTEMLKKRMYRYTTKRITHIHKRLTNKAAYADRLIRESMQNQQNIL